MYIYINGRKLTVLLLLRLLFWCYTCSTNLFAVEIGEFNKLDMPIVLRRGNLPSTYILEQMHFHWDAEHTIDGVRDPLELHIVHYNEEFGNFSNAAEHENGIVVIGVLFKVKNIVQCNNHLHVSVFFFFALSFKSAWTQC